MRSDLAEVARLFLRLGTTAFGGPAAHIAIMEDEVVRRRQWLTREQFLDYLGATNLIPGPNSTELALHVGRERAGWPGLVVAGISFILPASLMVGAAAWAYVRYGALPEVTGALYGITPVIIAIVAQALWGLGRAALKNGSLIVLAIVATLLVARGVHELVVLAAAGAIMALASVRCRRGVAGVFCGGAMASTSTGAAAAAVSAGAAPISLSTLFLLFLKIGSVLFGSGYVLLAFLRADLVERLGWLTERQLLDAIAVGQFTPGPVFTTATFVGYVLGGAKGATIATVGIFIPAFVFVAVSGPLIPFLRRSPIASAALDGVNAASLALMAVVSWQLGRAALVDPLTVAIATVSLIALVRYRVNSVWLIVTGAVLGVLATRGW